MNICMIGAGYVGLVSAACFSDFGWNVTCAEKDARKVEQLNRGEIPIYEPGLAESIDRSRARLHFSTELAPAVSANPYISFFITATDSGTLDFAWTDDDGSVIKETTKITVT